MSEGKWTCSECSSTDVQVQMVEWIYPNLVAPENKPHPTYGVVVNDGDPFTDGRNPDYSWCEDCGKGVVLTFILIPELHQDWNQDLRGYVARKGDFLAVWTREPNLETIEFVSGLRVRMGEKEAVLLSLGRKPGDWDVAGVIRAWWRPPLPPPLRREDE